MAFWRRKARLRELGEAEAYERTYGGPHKHTAVLVVKLPPRRPRDPDVLANGELLRRAFLDRLEHRDK